MTVRRLILFSAPSAKLQPDHRHEPIDPNQCQRSASRLLVFRQQTAHMTTVERRSENSAPRSGDFASADPLLFPKSLIRRPAASPVHKPMILKGLLMPTGTVKWFNSQKGFGFIQPDQGGPDAFVHISAVERAGLRDLREGQKVDFELVSDRKSGKMSADNLKVHA
jgi:CspA family cold shock protein